jgi:hypothetical protein
MAELKEIDKPAAYVLFIEFADDPPRVGVFDSPEEAEAILDAFEVTVFDPPQNDDLLAHTAHILRPHFRMQGRQPCVQLQARRLQPLECRNRRPSVAAAPVVTQSHLHR